MKCETHEPFEIERDMTGAIVRLHRLELDRLARREDGWRYLADDGVSQIVLPEGTVTWLPRVPSVDFPPGQPAQKEAPDNPWAGVALVTVTLQLHGANPGHPVGVLALTPEDVGLEVER